ncbi:MAG TPA: pyrroline-5-carboxylate reductase [Dehalococcoidia bacterium]|nr:pyrroline-5-carboxylate reductase [Dehalococcoidia bacterium]
MKIGVIGGGAMGEAIVAAVTNAGVTDAASICVADISQARLDYLRAHYGVETTASVADAVTGRDLCILAVKPQNIEDAARAWPRKGLGGTVVSIMAGVPIDRIARLLGTQAIVRAMPNTPAQIGEGMTVWTATESVPEAGRDQAKRVFAALGQEVFVPEERYLDMATALSGSGPAYVFLFIEALTDAGVHLGLARETASLLAVQTVLGSARYARETQRHPAELRNQVTSPGGTTTEALRVLEAKGVRAAVLEAVIAAYEKSRQLGQA